MAKKPVKKAPVKKAAAPTAAKKAPVKKTVAAVKSAPVKQVKKSPVKKSPVKKEEKKTVKATSTPEVVYTMEGSNTESECGKSCGSACQCKRTGFCRFMRGLIIVLVIFAIGFVAGKMCNKYRFNRPMTNFSEISVNGCVDMSNIKCPKLMEAMANADTNNDGCVSEDEFNAAKSTCNSGCKSECGMRHMRG